MALLIYLGILSVLIWFHVFIENWYHGFLKQNERIHMVKKECETEHDDLSPFLLPPQL